MEQVVIRRLKPGTLEPYRRVAEAKGRSLEAELRDLIENHRPKPPKDCERLLRLSDEALAMAPPEAPDPGSDSTHLIRQDRDADGGRDLDAGRRGDAAGC
jgi:hypothetical protein